MSDAMTMQRPRPYHLGSISTTHRDITNDKYKDLRRPRKVKFFANGERYFKGKALNVTPHRYLSFNDLLNDLTSKLPANVHLPYGVRQIYTPVAGHRVRNIEDLQDGASYVCAGFESFKTIKYGSESLQPWSHRKPHNHDFFTDQAHPGYSRIYGRGFQPGPAVQNSYPFRGKKGTFGSRPGQTTYWGTQSQDIGQMKPKVITVVRADESTETETTNVNQIKILLNKRSVQSFDQLMKDISEAFGPKWKNNKVKDIYTLKGKKVESISHFFRDDEIFIAAGKEGITNVQYGDVLDELYPDNPYAKNLMREWERTKKREKHKPRVIIQKSQNAYDDNKDDIKRDSGLGSDSSHKDEQDSRSEGASQVRGGKKKSDRYDGSGEEDYVLRMDRERQRAAEEEREKAKRRMQKRMDAEKRALEEEKRKRGLVPLKPAQDPFKKMLKEKEKEKKRKAAEDRAQREAEELRQEQQMKEPKEEPAKVILVVKEEEDEGKRSKSKSPQRHKDGYESDSESSKSRAKDRSPRRKTKVEEKHVEEDKEKEDEPEKPKPEEKEDEKPEIDVEPKDSKTVEDDSDKDNNKTEAKVTKDKESEKLDTAPEKEKDNQEIEKVEPEKVEPEKPKEDKPKESKKKKVPTATLR